MDQGAFKKVKEYVERYHMIAPNDIVVTGVSGGADSVCLLLMLCQLAKEKGFSLAAVHVNHGIRPEASEDAAYVKALCSKRGIPFVLFEEDVKIYAKRECLSEEEAGRRVRYKAFEEVLGKYAMGRGGKIAVAHNANDRAETMLFHLFRGTGLTGAGGMKPVRDNVIRPLLCLERGEIEEYLGEKGISFCIDRTNLEDTYTRNRIRNHILPIAEKEVCKGAVAHMCSAADLFLEADGYIRRQAGEGCKRCIVETGWDRMALDIRKLEGEDPFLRRQILLQCLEKLTKGRKDITSVHIEELGRMLSKQGNKKLSMPYGLKAKKEYGYLTLYFEEGNGQKDEAGQRLEIVVDVPEDPGQVLELDIPGLGAVELVILPKEKIPSFYDNSEIISRNTYTKWLDYDKITKSLMFRTRKTGDYLTFNKELSKKKLKNYMIEEKIPKDERGNRYILADGSHVVWVPGYRISEYYKLTGETKRILKVQIRGGL